VDADGNEMAGVASVLHQVPLGTYTGWNTVASGFYKGHIRTNTGRYIPFAKMEQALILLRKIRPNLETKRTITMKMTMASTSFPNPAPWCCWGPASSF
jgi:hypothetical protein